MHNVLFPQARRRTLRTSLRTRQAGIDTFLKLLIGHDFRLFVIEI
jgi:hypothetical protein